MVVKLMISLRSIKNRSKLFLRTNIAPELRNDTRWGSTYTMLQKYCELYPHLRYCGYDHDTLKLIPSVVHHNSIITLTKLLSDFQEVSKYLQTDDYEKVSMSTVRTIFDSLIEKYPFISSHLSKNADIVHSPYFDSAIVKIQNDEENSLTKTEKESVEFLLLPIATEDDEDADDLDSSSILQIALKNKEKKKRKKSKYRSTYHTSPTSNICERLFSRASHVMTPNRRLMGTETLEIVLMLRFNNDLWDPETIQQCMVGEAENDESGQRGRDEKEEELDETV